MGKHQLCNEDSCRWRRRKEARPGEILDAALELFTEKGFAATKLTEVAARAGVSKGTVYLYFDSKEALFQEMVKETLLPHLEQAELRVGSHEGSTSDLMHGLCAHWRNNILNTRSAGIPKLVIAEASNFPEMARFYMEKVVNRGTALVERILQRGVDKGEFREMDIANTARAVLAPMIFAAIYDHSLRPYDDGPYDVGKYLDSHLHMILDGLKLR
ncbi:MAG: TetR/AcrR family transcriptional regulator [Acidiferrobacterales bacterium]|jgi:AcrR family transcriptional regulator|nr:TetR/AcrR family transcriptional regulator [Acidiferrobacterales bacterium]